MNVINDQSKHIALRNFPNFDDIVKEYDNKYYQFIEWKGNRKSVYLQELSSDARAAFESFAAVLKEPELVAVVVGGFDSKIKERLIRNFGDDELQKRIFFQEE